MNHDKAVHPSSTKSSLSPARVILAVGAVAVAGWLAASTGARASEADPDQRLVDSVPAKAAMVLIVKSGEELRDDVYEFVRNAGLQRETVDWDGINPLGLSEQFEGRRGLAFFRRPPAGAKLGEGPEHGRWAALIPVANAQQALENLNAESLGNDLYAFSVRRGDVPDPLIDGRVISVQSSEDDGDNEASEPAPARNQQPQRQNGQAPAEADRIRLVAAIAQPDLLAVARQPETVRWFLANRQGPGLFSTWPSDQRQLFADSDLFFSINVEAFRPALLEKLDRESPDARPNETRGEEAGDLRPGDLDEVRMSHLARALTGVGRAVRQQARTAVEQTDSIHAGATIEPQRIRGTVQIAFEPASRLYEELAAVRPDSENLLDGLPDRPFLLAGGLNARPLEPLLARVTDQISGLVLSLTPQNEEAREQIKQQLEVVKRMQRVEGLVDFNAEGPLLLERSYFDDSQAVFDQVVTSLRDNDALARMFLPGNVAIEQKQTTVDGVKVTEFALRKQERRDGERPQRDGPQPDADGGAGSGDGLLENLTIQAAVADNSIIEAIGTQENPIRLLLEKDDESLRNRDAVQTTLDALPNEEVFAVLLIDPARIAQAFAEQMARAFSQGEQREQQLQRIRQRFEAGESAPPIGVSASTAGPGFSISAVVLADSLKPLTSMRLTGTAEDAEGARPPATPVEPE